ncbi:MAG: HEAT repeat domain-containing protein, partial [Planctomycetota bacterium]
EGDDTYICPNPKDRIKMNNWDSFGGIWPMGIAYRSPYAIHLDLGGNDDYQVRYHKNNSERQSFGHGIHIDTEWKNGDVIGKVENPLQSFESVKLPESITSSKYNDDIQLLKSSDVFTRFRAVGRIANSGLDIVPVLVEAIVDSEHRQFNRAVLECLHYMLMNKKLTLKETAELTKLLKAKDVEVRFIIADDFGIFGYEAEEELIEALKDSDSRVRQYSMRSLFSAKSKNGLNLAKEFALKDSSPDVRRTSVSYVTRVGKNKSIYPMLEGIINNDKDTSVRVAALEGIAHLQVEEGLELARKMSKCGNPYLERAAGKALAELYQIEGIEVLINSLSFPSMDAFYNYGYNVPNFIAAYAGHDLPGDDRYDQNKWIEWFKENKDKINIKENVDAYRSYNELPELLDCKSETEIIEKMEEFVTKYPNHSEAKKKLAERLNQVAWGMVTSLKDTKDWNPETGLKYAKRAVELEHEVNYIDTLAEAYLANNMLDESEQVCKEALKKHSGNKMFVERLQKIEEIRNTSK